MLIHEKLDQAAGILREQDVGLWLTLARETLLTKDPCLDLIAGTYCAWQSAFLVAASGERVAIVGRFDAPSVRELGGYGEVVAYDESLAPHLRAAIERLDPHSIALNYSTSDPAADGLTHGLWLVLQETLAGTPYANRLVSSAAVVNALRGRKSPEEVRRIRAAVNETEEIFERVTESLRPCLSELEIAAVMHDEVSKRDLGYAWGKDHCPAVNAGPDKDVGHSPPSELRLEHGQLLHVDFGVSRDDYTSDLQRVWYVPDGQAGIPADVASAWEALWAAVDAGVGRLEARRRRLGRGRRGTQNPCRVGLPRADVRARPSAGPGGARRRDAARPAVGPVRHGATRHRRGRQRLHARVRNRSARSRLHRARGGRARHDRRRRVAQHATARPVARVLTSSRVSPTRNPRFPWIDRALSARRRGE